jgi:phosphoserine aminotransferase
MGKIRYSFQPGPAQLHPSVTPLIQEALETGILTRYHRDEVWVELFARAQEALKKHLGAPEEWLVAFCSGATEAWHIWIQATADQTALHVSQGAFGDRWFELRKAISTFAKKYAWDFAQPSQEQVQALAAQYAGIGTVALVQVETSVGAVLPQLEKWRAAFPETLIALDATSSLGALPVPWHAVDFVFASAQKGLGLPAGFGVLLVSSRCIQLFRDYPAIAYNSLPRILHMAQMHQPISTPNLLGIYLIAKSLPTRGTVQEIAPQIEKRAAKLYAAFAEQGYEPLLPEPYRAATVLTFKAPSEDTLKKLHQLAEAAGLYLGRGYGPHKGSTFRVANFPALPDEAYEELLEVLRNVQ